ncbi:MAG: hypothetical protein DCC71_12935 [Proteobacteria bacterium]|nr:MAG: hypothetical protein DCC71_12935 [Pseudomonadota bacterium]
MSERTGGTAGDEPITADPLEPEDHGLVVEVGADEDVDGDYNGAPELAGLDETREWTGADALDGMRGRDAQAVNLSDAAPDAELAARLEEIRGEIVERLDSLRAEVPNADVVGVAPLDEADAIADPSSVETDLTERLERIDAALERIADGEYGLCVDCGQEISRRRLAAAPDVERCLQCDPPELA